MRIPTSGSRRSARPTIECTAKSAMRVNGALIRSNTWPSAAPCIPFTGYRKGGGSMDQANLRVLVMVQADGHYTADGDLRLAFSKQRKIDRCKSLLRAAAIQHCVRTYPDRVVFTIYSRHLPMWLRDVSGEDLRAMASGGERRCLFRRIGLLGTGTAGGPNSVQYTTCNRQNADMVQALAHITGRCAQIKVRHREQDHPHWKDAYVVDIWLKPVNCHEIRQKPVVERFAGTVYCAETPTGFFLVRRNGKVWITGQLWQTGTGAKSSSEPPSRSGPCPRSGEGRGGTRM